MHEYLQKLLKDTWGNMQREKKSGVISRMDWERNLDLVVELYAHQMTYGMVKHDWMIENFR